MNTMNLEKVKKVKRSKPFTVLDAIIVAVLVVVIALSAWAIFRVPAATVRITVNGKTRELPLNKNAELRLDHLTVHIKSGGVWVTDSDCRDGTCEHMGKITRSGQSIVCLPHSVVITITGKSELQWEIGR